MPLDPRLLMALLGGGSGGSGGPLPLSGLSEPVPLSGQPLGEQGIGGAGVDPLLARGGGLGMPGGGGGLDQLLAQLSGAGATSASMLAPPAALGQYGSAGSGSLGQFGGTPGPGYASAGLNTQPGPSPATGGQPGSGGLDLKSLLGFVGPVSALGQLGSQGANPSFPSLGTPQNPIAGLATGPQGFPEMGLGQAPGDFSRLPIDFQRVSQLYPGGAATTTLRNPSATGGSWPWGGAPTTGAEGTGGPGGFPGSSVGGYGGGQAGPAGGAPTLYGSGGGLNAGNTIGGVGGAYNLFQGIQAGNTGQAIGGGLALGSAASNYAGAAFGPYLAGAGILAGLATGNPQLAVSSIPVLGPIAGLEMGLGASRGAAIEAGYRQGAKQAMQSLQADPDIQMLGQTLQLVQAGDQGAMESMQRAMGTIMRTYGALQQPSGGIGQVLDPAIKAIYGAVAGTPAFGSTVIAAAKAVDPYGPWDQGYARQVSYAYDRLNAIGYGSPAFMGPPPGYDPALGIPPPAASPPPASSAAAGPLIPGPYGTPAWSMPQWVPM